MGGGWVRLEAKRAGYLHLTWVKEAKWKRLKTASHLKIKDSVIVHCKTIRKDALPLQQTIPNLWPLFLKRLLTSLQHLSLWRIMTVILKEVFHLRKDKWYMLLRRSRMGGHMSKYKAMKDGLRLVTCRLPILRKRLHHLDQPPQWVYNLEGNQCRFLLSLSYLPLNRNLCLRNQIVRLNRKWNHVWRWPLQTCRKSHREWKQRLPRKRSESFAKP